jgi:hypothetical protein
LAICRSVGIPLLSRCPRMARSLAVVRAPPKVAVACPWMMASMLSIRVWLLLLVAVEEVLVEDVGEGEVVETEGDGEVVWVGDGDGDGESLGEGDTESEGDGDGEGDSVGDGEGEGESDKDGEGEGSVWARLGLPIMAR